MTAKTRKVDIEGEVAEPPVEDQPPGGAQIGSLLIEIPLWKFGRIKMESSQKGALAIFVLCGLLLLSLILSGIEALPGEHPGVSLIMGKIGDALRAPRTIPMLGALTGMTGCCLAG